MSAYIAPVLNNGVLNTTFNSSDFEGTYPDSFLPLSGGNITGGLNVSENLGVGLTNPDRKMQVDGGIKVKGTGSNPGLTMDNVLHVQRSGNGTSYSSYDFHRFYSNSTLGAESGNTAMTIAANGNVGIGTSNPVAKFHIQGGSTGTLADTAVDGAHNRKYYYDTSIGLGETFSQSKSLGLFCGAYAAVRELTIGPWMTFTSDRRIKQNIVEIIDDDALQKLRLLKPCTYNYKDYMDNGANKVYGFIAQEVKEILPYAVNESTGPLSKIPNIYCFVMFQTIQ